MFAITAKTPRSPREGNSGLRRLLLLLLILLPCVLGILGVLAVQSHSAEPTPRRITHDGKRKEDLAWSPDGTRLAFSHYHTPGRVGISVVNADGSDLKMLSKDQQIGRA